MNTKETLSIHSKQKRVFEDLEITNTQEQKQKKKEDTMSNKKKEAVKPLNIYQKLLIIRKSVEYLKKEAKGHRYQYVKESQLLASLRPKMDEVGVFLEVDMMKPEISDGLLNIGFNFTWVNCDNPRERIEKTMYMQCVPGDPKLIGGILSYVNRYYLTKTFQIATDELDIDAFQLKTMDTQTITKPRISEDQLQELELEINGDEDLRKKILQHIPGRALANLTTDRFQAVKNWIAKSKEIGA